MAHECLHGPNLTIRVPFAHKAGSLRERLTCVMPRLMNAGAEHRFWENWPEQSERSPTTIHKSSLFNPPASFRKLVVLVDEDDADVFRGSAPEQAHLLDYLLAQPQVIRLRYRDEGPPSDVDPIKVESDGTNLFCDWVTAVRNGPDGSLTAAIVPVPSGGHGLCGAGGNFPETAFRDSASRSYSDRTPEDAARLRRLAVEALRVADAAQSDVLITNRPYLFENGRRHAQVATPMTPEEATAFISLFLRAQNIHLVDSGLHSHPVAVSRERFVWVGTRELLPASWRWFSACLQCSAGSGDDSLGYLAQSALQRVARAIRLRDQVHLYVNRPQNQDVAEDVLENLDSVFVALMGAMDVVARVAHRVLGLTSNEYRAGWQSKKWRKEVRQSTPALAALVESGSDGEHVLTILRLIRNSVHGEALHTRGYRTPQSYGTLVVLPRQDTTEISAAMDKLGGPGAWGVQQILDERIHVDDPGLLLENLLSRSLGLLDELMAKTPVEQMQHVDPDPKYGGPPPDEQAGEYGAWNEATRLSIRWQLGI